MTTVAEVVAEQAAALEAALEAVPSLRVYRDPGGVVDPPAAVLGPPSLLWRGVCAGPTEATFPVYVVTKADEHALERLWDLVPSVAAAVDTVPDAAVTGAEPGSYQSGAVSLPSYELSIGVGL